MAKPGYVGPLMSALVEYLAERKGTCQQIADTIGYSPRNVQKHIERLRARKSPLVANVLKGYRRPAKMQAKRVEPQTAQTIVVAAMRARTVLEVCWGPKGE